MLERQNGTNQRVVMAITTFADIDAARQFGAQLVEAQLVACINLVPGVESIYRWKGKVEQEPEVIAVMKTTENRLEELQAWVQEKHPYDEPEFLVLPVEAGASGYLGWARENVGREES
ncbi:MAG: divalent-cation tolerance protein CutA [Verrucomicrobiales bacterium]|jgi:periplasmic divalent cation tolerance protein